MKILDAFNEYTKALAKIEEERAYVNIDSDNMRRAAYRKIGEADNKHKSAMKAAHQVRQKGELARDAAIEKAMAVRDSTKDRSKAEKNFQFAVSDANALEHIHSLSFVEKKKEADSALESAYSNSRRELASAAEAVEKANATYQSKLQALQKKLDDDIDDIKREELKSGKRRAKRGKMSNEKTITQKGLDKAMR